MAALGVAGSLRASVGGDGVTGTSAAAAQADADRRERSNGAGGGTVAGVEVEAITEVPTQEEAWQLTALDIGSFDDTALQFRRGAAGRSCRARAA